MRRFGDRQFALAVGSYNGGPHNIGRWLHENTGMPFEEFVEEIQFNETRAYTRRVLEYYAVYCELYGNGAWPLLPDTTTADDPRVINF
jgi:soluble lytic murein transglycosylase